MNTDFRISVAFFDHRKTLKLLRGLQDHGVVCLWRLWRYATQHHPTGELPMTADDVEIAAGFTGEPGAFVKALRDCGWLDKKGRGWMLHDWPEHQPFASDSDHRAQVNRWKAHIRHHVKRNKPRPDLCDFCNGAAVPNGCSGNAAASSGIPRTMPEVEQPMQRDASVTGTDTGTETYSDTGTVAEAVEAATASSRPRGWRPPYANQRQFQYIADTRTKWIAEAKKRRLTPADADFDTEFQAAHGDSYEYWVRLREACEAYYALQMPRADA